MAKSTSLAALHSQSRAAHAEGKMRKGAHGSLASRVEGVSSELSALPVKPLLIGAGIGAAVLGSALALSSRRRATAGFTGMNQTLTKTALVALARVVSGQTLRSVATSALLDVADALKSQTR